MGHFSAFVANQKTKKKFDKQVESVVDS